MKATGIMRRVDDLGRVIIPKDIRRSTGIREGDPLEIYLGERGEVIFRKYHNDLIGQVDSLIDDIENFCDADNCNADIAIKYLEKVRELIDFQ